MKRNSRWVMGALMIGLGTPALVSCGKRNVGPPPKMQVAVETAVALKKDTPIMIQAFGTTQDRLRVDIVPQVSGLLVKTWIRDGDVVTVGQRLFEIDSRDYASRVQQAEGMAAADRANLELSRSTLERNRALLEKKLISPNDFDTLKARLDAAVAQLRIDEASLDEARLNLARCTLTAPLAGVCSKRLVDEGNLVTAGLTKLTNIRSYDPMIVEFSVPEESLSVIRRAVKEGSVKIEVAVQNDSKRYPGTVTFIDNAVSADTGTILLRGEVSNPDMALWSQQFVEVSIFAGILHDAVMVPEGAVQFGKSGMFLFVVSKENTAELRMVKTGVRYDNRIQITDGVAAGEKVVALGQLVLTLYPGASVKEASPAGTDLSEKNKK